MRRKIFWSASVSLPKLQSRPCQSARELGFFEESAGSCEKNAHFTSTKPFQRLDALTGDFRVRLDFPETLSRWVERDKPGIAQRLEICQPALGA